MVKVTDSERSDFPRLTAWIASNLRLVADDPIIWPAFLAATGLAEARARDAISGGISSPTLAVAELGGKDSAFDPARPTEIWLAVRLARAFEALSGNQQAQRLIGAALLAQLVVWSALRTRQPDGRAAALNFLATAYPVPPDRSWIPVAEDDGAFTIDLTDSDIEDLIRITWAEAQGEPPMGQAGVIYVVLNRVAATGFPNSVRGVIDQPVQFEPVLKSAGKSVAGLPAPSPAGRAAVAGIIEEIAAGTLPDPTNGATFFQNVAITSARDNGEFAVGVQPVAVIEHHSFFDRYKSGDPPVQVPLWRATTPTSRAQGTARTPLAAGVVI